VAVAAGAHVSVRAAAPRVMQRDGPESEGSTAPAFTPAATPQLHLDPEIERLMLQHYIRWWLGTTPVEGDAPTSVPTSPDPNAAVNPATSVGAPAVPGIPGLPRARLWSQLPLDPPLFTPLPPDRLFLKPDVGALFSGFGQRGVPVGPGDSQAVFDIYRRNQAIARALPDLRGMAPRFLRPLIPSNWRRDIAGALTSAAVSASLKHDYPTPIEISDRAWQSMTGATTTVIPLPPLSKDGTTSARALASRRNGARSQGPRTAAGKARTARNALKHGLCAHRLVLLDDENASEFRVFHAAARPSSRPRACSRANWSSAS
jgi:hypothetical protein